MNDQPIKDRKNSDGELFTTEEIKNIKNRFKKKYFTKKELVKINRDVKKKQYQNKIKERIKESKKHFFNSFISNKINNSQEIGDSIFENYEYEKFYGFINELTEKNIKYRYHNHNPYLSGRLSGRLYDDITVSSKKDIFTTNMTKEISNEKYYENGKINLDYYAKVITQKCKEKIKQRRKELGFSSMQKRLSEMSPIRHNQVEDIDKIASKDGRIKYFWFGLVYQITYISKDGSEVEKYAGMTAQSLTQRWHWYVKAALEKPEQWHYPVIELIRSVLFDETGYIEGDLKVNNLDWDWAKINAILENRFLREPKIICFNSRSLKEEEREYIRRHNLIEDGMNIREGGEGGHAADLPMFKIAQMIAKGMGLKEMKEDINWVSYTTIWKRIKDYWGSYEKAQLLFLRPMLKLLISIGFELFEINEAYGRFMHDAIKNFFGGNSFKQLRNLSSDDLNSLKYENLPPRTITGHVKYMIPGRILKKLILKHKTANSAVDDPLVKSQLSVYGEGSARQQIIYQIQQQLDYEDWIDARRHIGGNYIIRKLKENDLGLKGIYMNMGYNEPSAYSHTSLTKIFFFGLSSNRLINILRHNPSIKDYSTLEKFVDNLNSKKESLTKSKIDELLLKYLKTKKMIKELVGWTTGDFLNEVNKYYSNFKVAKWKVKFPYVLKKIRQLTLPYNPEEITKIFMDVGYSKNSNSSAIFRDMLFGMGVKDAIAFIRYYPEVSSYSDAISIIKEINTSKFFFKSRSTKMDTILEILNSLEEREYKTIEEISKDTGLLKRTVRAYLKDLTSHKILECVSSNEILQWRLIVSYQKIESLTDDSPIIYPWNEDPNFTLKDKIKPIRNKN